jgi:hypothetical protein
LDAPMYFYFFKPNLLNLKLNLKNTNPQKLSLSLNIKTNLI